MASPDIVINARTIPFILLIGGLILIFAPGAFQALLIVAIIYVIVKLLFGVKTRK